MKLKIFSIPFDPTDGFASAELEGFCVGREVLEVKEYWFENERRPWLALLLMYRDLEGPQSDSLQAQETKAKEPRRKLTRDEQTVYEALREWRAMRANRDGVPPYLVFNNRHLADLAHLKPGTKKALAEIPGVGPGKIERYAEDVFAILNQVVLQP